MARFPRSFMLNYRISGRERRYTIGNYLASLWATANERTFLAWVRTVAIVFPLQRRTRQSRPTLQRDGGSTAAPPAQCKDTERDLKRARERVKCHRRAETAARAAPGAAGPNAVPISRSWSGRGRIDSSGSCPAVARAE